MTNRNANRPGYKKTRVGWIPEEWEVRRLDEIAKITMGQSPKSEFYNSEGEGLPLIQGNSDIENRKTKPRFWTSEVTKKCQPGDLILSVRAPVGSVAKSNHLGCIGRGVCSISPKKSFDFLYQLLVSMEPVWNRYAQGSTFEAVVSTDVRGFRIPFPPLEEQCKIAEILSTWDRAIEQTRALIDAKQRLKRGLMQQLLTGRLRFPGFGPPAREKGELPAGWRRYRLGNLVHVFSGGTPSRGNENYYGGSIPWIKSGELNQRFISETEETITESGLNSSSAKVVKKNTLLYALYGATAGIPSITRIDAAINQAILAIEPKSLINRDFLYYWFAYSRDWLIRKYTQGGQPNLSGKLVKSFEIMIPTKLEQERIVDILLLIDEQLLCLSERIEFLHSQKDGLMQALLSGKTRVS